MLKKSDYSKGVFSKKIFYGRGKPPDLYICSLRSQPQRQKAGYTTSAEEIEQFNKESVYVAKKPRPKAMPTSRQIESLCSSVYILLGTDRGTMNFVSTVTTFTIISTI